ncbi:MAG: ABC transporter substrate-binding protein [Clostridia bacterium]|nr:ABC transporter substrate-binding protein [Clostridia bacterium]
MKKRKFSLVFFGVLLFGLLTIAGCGQSNSSTGGDSKTTEAKPIVIGVATALGSIEGADSLRSVELAVDEVNASGGVTVKGEKRPLKVVSIDTREHEPGLPVHDALAALEKLITQEKPDALLVGSFRSEVMLSAMDLIAKYKVPNIISIAMSPEFEKKLQTNYENYKYNFRMGPTSANFVQYLSKTMEFIGKENGFNKAYIVNQEVLWAEGTAKGVKKYLEANGWQVIGKDTYATGASDFSASLTKAKNGGAQIIVPVFDMPQSGVLIKQAKSMKVPAIMVGHISPATNNNAWNTFGGDVDGLVNFVHEIGSISISAVPKSATFIENFGKKHGEDKKNKMAGHGTGPAYDSVFVLTDAIQRADSVEADAIVEALKKTDTDGVIGKIKFNENHQVIYDVDPKTSAMGVAFQWVDGKRIPVFPEAAAEAKVKLPDYMNK